MRKSRLSKISERKSKQNLLITIIGIIAILFLFFRYGIPFLGNIGFFFGQLTSITNDSSVNNENDVHVASPGLDPISRATSQSEITIKGTASPGLTVELYLNGFKEEESIVNDEGNFEFLVTLTEGENIIKARSVSDTKESDFSQSQTVVYKKTSPEISIDSPADGSEIKGENPITVKGQTDPDVSVTVNGFKAIINPDNTYSYSLLLREGSNEIKVVAEDLAGNSTEKTISVAYSQ
ncbi:MAG: hypothetical protein A3A51_04765 [Candidatus Levybacteria bacterium RIFCSPLOWO2_01_FULL_39_10]|nr:MAG: hypothetical protein A3A51_04765 [Candidatus Levybacteria bacterium RIFCSPLOWO2_01_FULL_39_10]